MGRKRRLVAAKLQAEKQQAVCLRLAIARGMESKEVSCALVTRNRVATESVSARFASESCSWV